MPVKATKQSQASVCIFELHRLAEVKAGTLVGNFSELDESVSVYATFRIKHFSFESCCQKTSDRQTSIVIAIGTLLKRAEQIYHFHEQL